MSISKCTGCPLGTSSSNSCIIPLDPYHTISLWIFHSQNSIFINNPLEEIIDELPKTNIPTILPHVVIYPSHTSQTLFNPLLLDDLAQICKIQLFDSITFKYHQNTLSFESKKSKLTLISTQNPISSILQTLIGALHSAPSNFLITIKTPLKISFNPIPYINHEIKHNNGSLVNHISRILQKKQIKIKTEVDKKNLNMPDDHDDILSINNLLSPKDFITTGKVRDIWVPCLI
jgi:hypothetical protein